MAAVSTAPMVWRPGRPADLNFVRSTWAKSHTGMWFSHTGCTIGCMDRWRAKSSERYQSRSHDPACDQRAFSTGLTWLMNALLDRCALSIAAFDESDDHVLGWAVTSDRAVHYVYVSAPYRRTGIGRVLLAPYLEKPTVYTFPPSKKTPNLKIPHNWIYDPWHAFRIASLPKPGEITHATQSD